MEKTWKNYMDEQGRMLSYPSNKKIREQLLSQLVQRFEEERHYTEPEVNEILKQSLLFSDYELIRRELYQYHFIDRTRDGSAYWREKRKTANPIAHRLIMIEGLPGAGKTTMARKIGECLKTRLSKEDASTQVKVYCEGDLHPTDMAWCACVPTQELATIYKHYPAYQEVIEKNMSMERIEEKDYAVIAYTAFDIAKEDSSLFSLLESYEIYDGRVNADTFMGIHRKRWERFANQRVNRDEINIFECTFFQNAINELLLFDKKKEADIERYLRSIVKHIKQLSPVLIYLEHEDLEASLTQISEERINPETKEREWEKRVAEYIEQSPYGKVHGYTGVSGMHQYFADRYVMERNLLEHLADKMEVYVVQNDNYENAWQEVEKTL